MTDQPFPDTTRYRSISASTGDWACRTASRAFARSRSTSAGSTSETGVALSARILRPLSFTSAKPPSMKIRSGGAPSALKTEIAPGRIVDMKGARSEERRVGKSVSVRVDLGGRSIIKKKKTHKNILIQQKHK